MVQVLRGRAGEDASSWLASARRWIEEETAASGFSERCLPGFSPVLYVSEHIQRYLFAARFLGEGPVLDVASGMGYGTALLVRAGAGQVTGIEISSRWARFARAVYGSEGRARFVCADGQSLPLADSSIDVVTSFETLEHVPDWRRFLDELGRVLRPGGRLVLSTPNRLVVSPGMPAPANPFHLKEFEPAELRRELEDRFGQVQMFGQSPAGRRWREPLLDVGRTVLAWLPGGARLRSRISARVSPWATSDLTPQALEQLAATHQVYPLPATGPPAGQLVAVCTGG